MKKLENSAIFPEGQVHIQTQTVFHAIRTRYTTIKNQPSHDEFTKMILEEKEISKSRVNFNFLKSDHKKTTL